LFYFEGILA